VAEGQEERMLPPRQYLMIELQENWPQSSVIEFGKKIPFHFLTVQFLILINFH